MSTISENLQILKDSTDAIKQAIIDKGGTIEGDISTWASSISGISGGGSTDEEITFTGRMDIEPGGLYITGSLSTSFSTYKRIWAFTYGDVKPMCSTAVIMDDDVNVSLSLTSGGILDLDPSLVTMFLTDIDGANAKLIKINLSN